MKLNKRKMLMKKSLPKKQNYDLADKMILSHLSSKRKDYDREKFDKIFENFDTEFEKQFGIKSQKKKELSNIRIKKV